SPDRATTKAHRASAKVPQTETLRLTAVTANNQDSRASPSQAPASSSFLAADQQRCCALQGFVGALAWISRRYALLVLRNRKSPPANRGGHRNRKANAARALTCRNFRSSRIRGTRDGTRKPAKSHELAAVRACLEQAGSIKRCSPTPHSCAKSARRLKAKACAQETVTLSRHLGPHRTYPSCRLF